MTLKITKQDYVTVSPGDDLYTFTSGLTQVPRASIVIDMACPEVTADLITQAYNRGWLKAVAHIPGKEATWEKLK
jgi:hypothetical protein